MPVPPFHILSAGSCWPDQPAQERHQQITTACERILRTLPQWFGIEPALQDYARAAAMLPTWFAEERGVLTGFITLTHHFERSWEIHCMAVETSKRGNGIGRALVAAAISAIADERAAFLSVKTLSPSREDAAYAETRAFYSALGFVPLFELPDYWSAENPCLVVVRRIDPLAPDSKTPTSA